MNTNLTLCRHWAKLCVAICQHCFIKEQNRNKDEVGSKFFHDHLFVPRVYLQCHPSLSLSCELKFLINYQLCLPSEDCWNVSLLWHCVARHFFIQLIIWYLSILSHTKTKVVHQQRWLSSTDLSVWVLFVVTQKYCTLMSLPPTPIQPNPQKYWCDSATNLKFRLSQKIK